MALCRSCRKTADHCSYPDEAKPGCLRDKRMREGVTATLGPTAVPYAMAKIKLRAIFPDATRIEINPEWLEVEGPPLLPMPSLAQALAVLTTVWGSDTDITPEFNVDGGLLRIERGQPRK